jgi:hypothetical protein
VAPVAYSHTVSSASSTNQACPAVSGGTTGAGNGSVSLRMKLTVDVTGLAPQMTL